MATDETADPPAASGAAADEARGGEIVWFRRDLRLADHPALTAAIAAGGPVWPVFVLDPVIEATYGAASKWRLSKSLKRLSADIAAMGGRLILRRGPALETLQALAAETGARVVRWSRLYDPASIERDTAVKAGLKAAGLGAHSHPGHLLFDPFGVRTKTGGMFKVYTPFWRACRALDAPAAPLPAPARWPVGAARPRSEALGDLGLERAVNRGGAVLERFASPGETAARARLDAFLDEGLGAYAAARDRTDRPGTSRLSEHLALGEISPRSIWHATEAMISARPETAAGGEVFLKELVWREFAWHLLLHTPHIQTRNWRPQWDAFPWRGESPELERWRRGRTGVPMVDAAMREMYVTGVMHNRTRMLTASYLTKHLLTDWRLGEAWFRACLTDWDPASNAMGWQWTAGSGPDAAPYFRIYNPDTQAEKFDPAGAYRARWLPERARSGGLLDAAPHPDGLAFFDACPRAWGASPEDPYPEPAISLAQGRQRALDAYAELRKAGDADAPAGATMAEG